MEKFKANETDLETSGSTQEEETDNQEFRSKRRSKVHSSHQRIKKFNSDSNTLPSRSEASHASLFCTYGRDLNYLLVTFKERSKESYCSQH